VWEWVQDWSAAYPEGAAVDPVGPAAGGIRVLRGGSWYDDARSARAARRGGLVPDVRDDRLGFRPARSLP
jgi:formylglycine-generating enzyme required for sulfatase activity